MPTLPALPDVIFRTPEPERDADAVCAVILACVDADQIDPCSTLEGWPTLDDTKEALASSVPDNAIVAEIDGQIVAYNRVLWWKEEGDLWLFLHTGRIHPAHRGRGIGTALLEWSEARIRELAPQIAEDGTPLYGANASSTEVDATRLLQDHHYEIAFTLAQMRYADLSRAVPSVVEGIVIRPARLQDAEAMHAAQRDAWSDGLVGVPEEDDEDLVRELRDTIRSGGANGWRIAWDGDTIAGQVWCSIQENAGVKYGVFDEVNTSRGYRRRGIAQALMTHMLAEFAAQGCTEARLHTDAGNRNGARSLYEKLGFVTLKTFPRYRKALK